jgi:hypothetical protein
MTTPVAGETSHATGGGIHLDTPAGIPPCCLPGAEAHPVPPPPSPGTHRRLTAPPAKGPGIQ